jgi:hypothetical protein
MLEQKLSIPITVMDFDFGRPDDFMGAANLSFDLSSEVDQDSWHKLGAKIKVLLSLPHPNPHPNLPLH